VIIIKQHCFNNCFGNSYSWCGIWGFHGGVYSSRGLPSYDAVIENLTAYIYTLQMEVARRHSPEDRDFNHINGGDFLVFNTNTNRLPPYLESQVELIPRLLLSVNLLWSVSAVRTKCAYFPSSVFRFLMYLIFPYTWFTFPICHHARDGLIPPSGMLVGICWGGHDVQRLVN
jgi:hypothetical protein